MKVRREPRRMSPSFRRLVAAISTSAVWLAATSPGLAQDQNPTEAAPTPPTTGRLFGVLPNTATVEANTPYGPVTTRQTFSFALDDSFDKFVFPFVGAVAYLGVGQPQESYWKRYATAFADNTIGNFMTTAIFPTIFHQDPRYFQLGAGGLWHRAAYAASRVVITRGRRDAHQQFNISEIGGNAATSVISDTYYPAEQHSAHATLARMGSQVMWDAVSFECKEFWPDIRQTLQQMFHHQQADRTDDAASNHRNAERR